MRRFLRQVCKRRMLITITLCIVFWTNGPDLHAQTVTPITLVGQNIQPDSYHTSLQVMRRLQEPAGHTGWRLTGAVFSSKEEVLNFVDYFKNNFYLGEVKLTMGYQTYSDRPGLELIVQSQDPAGAVWQHNMAEARVKELIGSLGGKIQREKAEAIYSYVYQQIDYDHTLQKQSVYSALYEGKGICMGYARTFQLMCQRAGMACEIVYGTGHAWNRVLVDKDWEYVDITWSKSSHRNDWYFITEEQMNKDHY